MRAIFFIFLVLNSLEAFALINGAPLIGAKDVVRIRLTNGWVCSGVFIDPFTILTAAHCISPGKDNEKIQVDKIESADNSVLDLAIKNLIPHSDYSAQYWPSYDVGIIKTSRNPQFEGRFQIQENPIGHLQEAVLMGCGRTDYENKIYSRTTGENGFLQIGAVLFFLGESIPGKMKIGLNVSVAPNDSGGPILEKASGKIVGVMTTTTLKDSLYYGVPALSTGASTAIKKNLIFIKNLMGEKGNEQ
jgi:hypothetical protein